MPYPRCALLAGPTESSIDRPSGRRRRVPLSNSCEAHPNSRMSHSLDHLRGLSVVLYESDSAGRTERGIWTAACCISSPATVFALTWRSPLRPPGVCRRPVLPCNGCNRRPIGWATCSWIAAIARRGSPNLDHRRHGPYVPHCGVCPVSPAEWTPSAPRRASRSLLPTA